MKIISVIGKRAVYKQDHFDKELSLIYISSGTRPFEFVHTYPDLSYDLI